MRLVFLSTLFTAFFLSSFAQADSKLKNWSALLHLHTSKAYINLDGFYLTKQKSYQSELDAHLKAFNSDNGLSLACRFPARYTFLREHFDLPIFNLDTCQELTEFRAKAPADQIQLVFASESLTRPASAMGHSLLKISGTNQKGLDVDHNISFFTRMDDVDPFTLVIQSFITGKRGYYTLAPYGKTQNYYLYGEERNLFEYELSLSENQKKLLALHLFELKDIEFTYFFHAFNCATLIRNILAVAYPDISEVGHFWVTPLDIARHLRKHDLIQQTSFRNTHAWQIKRLLLENKVELSKEKNSSVADDGKSRYARYLLLDAKNKYEFELSEKSKESFLEESSRLESKYAKEIANFETDVSSLHDPSRTIQDSSLGLGYFQTNKTNYLQVELLPVSHFLTSDLFGYEFESEVQLFSMQFGVFEDYGFSLLQLKPLSLLSLIPHDKITGGWSTKIDFTYSAREIGFQELYTAQVLRGKTVRLSQDLDIYLLAGGQANSIKGGLFYAQVEGGAVLREVFRMKTHLYGNHYRNFSDVEVTNLYLDHGISINKGLVNLRYQKSWSTESTFDSLGLSGHWLF